MESDRSVVTAERVRLQRQSRFNPIRGLTPARLSNQLEAWRLGYLRDFALTADAMMSRDDTLVTVVSKREKDTARCQWEIGITDTGDDAERAALALKQKEHLAWFYNHLTATEALDEDVRGGTRTLFRQMMRAVGMKKAAHEIMWQPAVTPDGPRLTGEFRYVPLWFFEQRGAKLRFLEHEHATDGVDLQAGKWLITSGDGLMEASAVAYILKHLPLKDLVSYSERFGQPYVVGKTRAAKDSDGWKAMREAVQNFIGDGGAVCAEGDLIELVTASSQGTLPQQVLIELMSRALATIWRGGDLSTMSKDGQAVGSEAQEEEANVLVEDDCAMISEALNTQVDRIVLEWAFGAGVEALAYFLLKPPTRQNIDLEIKIDHHLVSHGARLSKKEAMERYGRTEAADENDDVLDVPGGPAAQAAEGQPPEGRKPPGGGDLANEATKKIAANIGVPESWTLPLADLLDEIEAKCSDAAASEADLLALLRDCQARLPELLGEMDTEGLAAAIEAGLSDAALEGLRAAVAAQKKGGRK